MKLNSVSKRMLNCGIAGILVCPTAAFAQDSSGYASGGDIIVTARRTEERLQDVPISITVYSQDQLDKRNIVTGTDLATYTPSLSVNQKYGPEKASFAIRGFVQDMATAPSVGVYFAEVPMPLIYGATTTGGTAPTGSLMDLQNLQVLKGPQGTLFGRNTTGGAVLVVPRKPTDRLEGHIEGSAGSYGMLRRPGRTQHSAGRNFQGSPVGRAPEARRLHEEQFGHRPGCVQQHRLLLRPGLASLPS